MVRPLVMLSILLLAVGCRLPPDQQPLKPLPEDGLSYSYVEILARARAQASAALEAFYLDAWKELEAAGLGLEQTARFLPRTSDQPLEVKEHLILEAKLLHKDALRLVQAAQVQDVHGASETLQKIHLKIRSLRPKEPTKKD